MSEDQQERLTITCDRELAEEVRRERERIAQTYGLRGSVSAVGALLLRRGLETNRKELR